MLNKLALIAIVTVINKLNASVDGPEGEHSSQCLLERAVQHLGHIAWDRTFKHWDLRAPERIDDKLNEMLTSIPQRLLKSVSAKQ